jgi:hypothetical protein
MTSRLTPSRQPRSGFLCLISGGADVRMTCRALRHAMRLATLAAALAVFALPQPAGAWWHGRPFNPGVSGGFVWGPGPLVLFPFQRPHPEYRYSVPPGAPLSYDDPNSGTTYCWSQTTGFYFVCAYGPQAVVSVSPVLPIPSGVALSPGEPTAPAASGVLLFRLPQGAQATIDGVPIGLSDGLGIHALAPGSHRVVLHVFGKETAHTVNVRSHKIFTVTPAGIAATEP